MHEIHASMFQDSCLQLLFEEIVLKYVFKVSAKLAENRYNKNRHEFE